MVDDVVLWFLFAAAILLIWCGCKMTARGKRPLALDDGGVFDRFDEAA